MKLIGLFIILLVAQISVAQNIYVQNDYKQAIYARYGIEPTLVAAIGYNRMFLLDKSGRTILANVEYSTPSSIPGFKNFEFKLGGTSSVYKKEKFGATFNLSSSFGGTQNQNFSSKKIATNLEFQIGLFKQKWYLTFLTEYEKLWAVRIDHTDYYLQNVYPEAKSGWYKNSGGNFQLGLEYGYNISKRIELIFDFKIPKSEHFNSYYGSPAHTNLQVDFRI